MSCGLVAASHRNAWWVVGILAVAPTLGCASGITPSPRTVSSPAELLAAAPLGSVTGGPPAVPDAREVLAVSAEMRAFADRYVARKGSANLRLLQLTAAIVDDESFGLEYDAVTLTAAETFRQRRGNCLSFSNLFVALAREVGIGAQFQEVDVPPDWALDHDSYVLNRHVNVRVHLGAGVARVVDFNLGEVRAALTTRRITDERALAHYYNNLGVERMQAGDTAAALECFRRALTEGDGRFSPAWSNLATLFLRAGHLSHAEGAYLQALDASRGDLVAMSNLARLYERQGDEARSGALRRRVAYHRMRNPYYRHHLALKALSTEKYDEAIRHLRYAARKRSEEDQFCYLLGVSYLAKGDESAARKWFARAAEVAASEAAKRRYAGKLDALLRRPPAPPR